MKKYISILAFSFLFGANGFTQNKWWNETTAYEIFVRSFYDSNGDGIGDFNGMTQKLDYLNDGNPATANDLGIGLVWLMPINSSPSYHGYDVTNYLALNPQYGTDNDFKTMLTQAHNRGIKVIMDLVINHSSDKHPWFIKSANNDAFYRDFYRWETSPSSQTGPWGQQLWYPKNGSNYYALFWSGMPDLNFNYQPVKDSIFAAAKYWIKDMGVDGFRLDAAMYLYEEGTTLKNHPKTLAFWKEFNDSCKSWNSNSLLVGEVWDSPENIALYTDKLDLCFDFNLADANMNAANTGNPYNSRVAINTGKTIFKPNQFASFLTNHDQNRVIDVFSNNLDKNKAAASLLFTQGGVPFIYYGEEVAMKGSKPDENIRMPMQWSGAANGGFTTGSPWRALNSNYTTYNVASMQLDENSIWNHYQKLIQIRKEQPILQTGTHTNITSSEYAVHSYQRSLNGKDVLVLVNTSNIGLSNVQMDITKSDGKFGNYQIEDIFNDSLFSISSNSSTFSIKVNLKPYQTRILQFGYPVGVEEENWNPSIQLFPNPAKDQFNIQLSSFQSNVWLELYAIDGKLLYREEQLQKNMNHSVNLPNGIYIVKVNTLNGKSWNQKLVISN
jgi:glycosidase